MVETAVDKTDRLDVLFNNAGIAYRTYLVKHQPDQFEELIRINLFGPVYGMRYAIPVMRSVPVNTGIAPKEPELPT